MNREKFWALVDDSVAVDPEQTIENLREALGELSARELEKFHDQLSEVLFELDRRDLARQKYRFFGAYDGPGETGDHFLFARCAVVLSGSSRFTEIQHNPAQFSGSWSYRAQDVFDAVEDAYEDLTREEWDYASEVDYETGANAAAW
ncbi:DUF4240 domain-containing protein [Kitasatospora sp. NPDC058115]|uniref:DUF4240 domain-containing protein n=1 Tax=Kitasatospora sp. NPDC058115 TaxID=3346347 RepID=UPI0036D9320A